MLFASQTHSQAASIASALVAPSKCILYWPKHSKIKNYFRTSIIQNSMVFTMVSWDLYNKQIKYFTQVILSCCVSKTFLLWNPAQPEHVSVSHSFSFSSGIHCWIKNTRPYTSHILMTKTVHTYTLQCYWVVHILSFLFPLIYLSHLLCSVAHQNILHIQYLLDNWA
jgi:hypothetical protein